MVKLISYGLSLAVLLDGNMSHAACSKASEFEPALCPLNLPSISTIEIIENGARSSPTADPELDCGGFKLDVPGVRRYFTKGRRIENQLDIHHKLDWLPCYASGTMRFVDGKKATWSIEQGRTGTLAIEQEAPVYLYCPHCKFKPFLH